jgi:hypothetical protein
MSHLIIEQGKDVGREVTVPPTGMKFGRSPANDLVLEDNSVMLFHGRFFFKSDGSLWVTDFGAGEKTTVGGVPVDEYALSVGDLVEVGATAFRIINVAQDDSEAPAPTPTPVAAAVSSADEEIDLGFKGSKKVVRPAAAPKEERPKSSLMHRLMQVGMVLLVLVVLVIVAPGIMELAKDDTVVVQQKDTLALSYERVRADTKNIFRYYLDLDEKGNFSIKIDDLKLNRHIMKTGQVNETLLLQLSNSIEDAGFFNVDSDFAGAAEGQHDLYDIAVQRNRRYHHIKVLNRAPPQAIKRTVSVIEDFAMAELDIPFTLLMKPEELMLHAEQAFDLAEARYAERDVRYGNLAEAIKHYEETMLYLETIEPKPAVYHDAADGLLQASNERDARYEDYMFRADRAIRLKDHEQAAKYLRILTELIPDRSDARYEKVSAKLLNIEHHLR